MNIYKKAVTFLAALLISASALMPAASVYADEEDTGTTSASEAAEDTAENTEQAEEVFTSGAFKYIKLTDSTVSIEDCTSTDTELTIPETLDGLTVTELGKKALGKDYKEIPFTKVTLPKTIEYISADNPFLYCERLETVEVDPESEYFTVFEGSLYTKDMKKLVVFPMARKDVESFTVPDGVETLGASSIYNTYLTAVKLPDSLKQIDHHALSFNMKITELDLSKTKVEEIDDMAFAECNHLKDVKLPETLTDIGLGAFMKCSQLEEIDLPKKLYYVGQNAFRDTGLKHIVIPESVEDISYCAFGYVTSAYNEEIADPDFVVVGAYGSAAHRYCTDSDADYDYKNNFTFLTFEEYEEERDILSLDRITDGSYVYAVLDGNAVILECKASDAVLTVPDKLGGYTVTSIYPASFSLCTSSEIIIPETVTTIKKIAFFDCKSVEKITLPKSVKSVNDNAFDSCTMLREIDMGGTAEVGDNIFNGCTALKTINFSKNIKSFAGDSPFDACTALENINVEAGSEKFSSIDGVLFNEDGTALYYYPVGRKETSYTVPKGVKKITSFSFYGCRNLEDLVLAKETEEIEKSAIYNNLKLVKLRAYNKVKTVGEYAFGYYYSETTDANGETQPDDKIVSGFKLFADKKSKAYDFAKDNNITVVTGTIRIGTANVRVVMLGILGAALLGALAALIAVLTGKKRKNKQETSQDKKKKEKKAPEKSSKEDKEEEGEGKDNEA